MKRTVIIVAAILSVLCMHGCTQTKQDSTASDVSLTIVYSQSDAQSDISDQQKSVPASSVSSEDTPEHSSTDEVSVNSNVTVNENSKAYTEGYDQGYNRGFELGYDDGFGTGEYHQKLGADFANYNEDKGEPVRVGSFSDEEFLIYKTNDKYYTEYFYKNQVIIPDDNYNTLKNGEVLWVVADGGIYRGGIEGYYDDMVIEKIKSSEKLTFKQLTEEFGCPDLSDTAISYASLGYIITHGNNDHEYIIMTRDRVDKSYPVIDVYMDSEYVGSKELYPEWPYDNYYDSYTLQAIVENLGERYSANYKKDDSSDESDILSDTETSSDNEYDGADYEQGYIKGFFAGYDAGFPEGYHDGYYFIEEDDPIETDQLFYNNFSDRDFLIYKTHDEYYMAGRPYGWIPVSNENFVPLENGELLFINADGVLVTGGVGGLDDEREIIKINSAEKLTIGEVYEKFDYPELADTELSLTTEIVRHVSGERVYTILKCNESYYEDTYKLFDIYLDSEYIGSYDLLKYDNVVSFVEGLPIQKN